MKNLGIFLWVPPGAGGMFQYTQSLLEAMRPLQKNGWRIEAAYTNPLWAPILRNYPFNATELKNSKFGLWLANVFMALMLPGWLARTLAALFNPLPRQLKALNCDAWIFPAQDPLGWQVNVPTIVSVHDLMHKYEPYFPESLPGRYSIREHRFRSLTKFARCVLVDSEIGKQQVMESYGIAAEKIFPLPYIAPRYVHETIDRPDFDQNYKLPKKFIFYPAQFWAHKNHDRLLNAAAGALKTCPDLHLVFSGDKRLEYDNLVRQAAQLGVADHISFVGYVPEADLPGFYHRARAMIFPTFFGPTNIPPLEAFVCGCPAAVSNIYAMPEQAGGAALLFDPNSVDEIRQTLEKLWQDDALCAELSKKGKARAALWGQEGFNATFCKILDNFPR